MFEELRKYVFLPKDMVRHFGELLKKCVLSRTEIGISLSRCV